MSYDWTEFNSVARGLLQNLGSIFPQEGGNRSAISRSYYAAFCSARTWLRSKNIAEVEIERKGIHERVIETLRINGAEQIAVDLRKLKDHRILADYRDNMPSNYNLSNNSSLCFFLSKKLINDIGKLS